MTETTSPALRTALAYYHAWTRHDLDKAMSYIATGIVCDAPAGRLEGTAALPVSLSVAAHLPVRADVIGPESPSRDAGMERSACERMGLLHASAAR
jgi:hypothetical protein